jgi:hypothetical protein
MAPPGKSPKKKSMAAWVAEEGGSNNTNNNSKKTTSRPPSAPPSGVTGRSLMGPPSAAAAAHGHLTRMPSPLASPVRASTAGAAASKKAREEALALELEAAKARESAREAAGVPKPPVQAKVDSHRHPPAEATARPRAPEMVPFSRGGGGGGSGGGGGAGGGGAAGGGAGGGGGGGGGGGEQVTTALWDLVSRAVDKANEALDDAAKAVATEGTDANAAPSTGTAGFGKAAGGGGASSSSAAARATVSGTTRKRVTQRAAVKLRTAREELGDLAACFTELRRHSAALADALARAEHAQTGVTRQLQSTAGYAEEQAVRLREVENGKRQADFTARQMGDALEHARQHIAELTARLKEEVGARVEAAAARDELAALNARREADARAAGAAAAADRAEATAARDALAAAVDRGDRGAESAARHKEAVAKLTADNMIFLMRLKESETELVTMRRGCSS